MPAKVYVLLSIDVEPFSKYSKNPDYNDECVFCLKPIFEKNFREQHGNTQYNLFAQVDILNQIKKNALLFTFNKYKNFLLAAKEQGDEIGLHFHTTLLDQNNEPYQSTEESAYQHIAEQTFSELKKEKYDELFQIKASHIGCNFGNNYLFKKFKEFGILTDGSCMAGITSKGDIAGTHNKRFNLYDWQHAPHVPYFPDPEHYHKLYDPENESEILLELPMTMVGKVPFTLTAHSSWTRRHIETVFNTAKQQDTFVFLHGWLHSYDLRDKKQYSRFIQNLKLISEISKQYTIAFEFITYSKARELWLTTDKTKRYTQLITPQNITYSFSEKCYQFASKVYNQLF